MVKRLVAGALVLAIAVTSADAQKPRAARTVSADQLMANFVAAWNAHDTLALQTMFSDSIALVGRQSMLGRAAVDWARQENAHTKSLRVTPLYSRTIGDMAYQVGRYRLRSTQSDTLQTGVHTFTYRRAPDGNWKLESMYIVPDPAR